MRKAILDRVPKGTEELNMRAFEAGLSYAAHLSQADGAADG